jgi:phage regulator Rha-like protein
MSKKEIIKGINIVPEEVLITKIYYIRKQKVMMDTDLAELYGVETKRLKEQVRRNISRFPSHFMFQLTRDEYDQVLRSQNATLEQGGYSKYLPYVFTEHGVLMLSNVLKSEQAIQASIAIINVFVKLREKISNYTEYKLDLETLKNEIARQAKRQDHQDKNIELVFHYLDELMEKRETTSPERKSIGYEIGKDKV